MNAQGTVSLFLRESCHMSKRASSRSLVPYGNADRNAEVGRCGCFINLVQLLSYCLSLRGRMRAPRAFWKEPSITQERFITAELRKTHFCENLNGSNLSLPNDFKSVAPLPAWSNRCVILFFFFSFVI